MSGYICDCGSNYSHPDQVIACARDNHGVPREDPKDAELTRLRAREAVVVKALAPILRQGERQAANAEQDMRHLQITLILSQWHDLCKALATISDDSE